jgi:hypothetical protein
MSRAGACRFTALTVLVATVVLAAACAPGGGPSPAPAKGAGFAFNGGFIGVPATQRNADLDRAKAMGARWVRVPFNWSTLEMHGKGRYNWGPADGLVAAASKRGLKIVAVVSYAPRWARPSGSNDITPPRSVHDYADFLHAAARRYRPRGVRVWEIWNEPNLHTMWAPRPNVARYTALLKAAYPRIKAADPGATVLTGGMSPAWDAPDGSEVLPLTWVRGIYRNGGHGYFDAVGHHPSSFPYASTTKASWNAFQQSRAIHDLMRSKGDGAKKIWATEIGFPTGRSDRAVSEKVQGARFAESLAAWRRFSFAGPIMIYEVRDAGPNLDDHYQNFGVHRRDGRPKASVPKITQAMHAANG